MSASWVYNASPEVSEQSNYRTILGVGTTLLVLMVITIAARLYVRIFMLKAPGWDDWVITAAAVSNNLDTRQEDANLDCVLAV
jgi:hypothetical protein